MDTPGSSKDGVVGDFLARSPLSARPPAAHLTLASSHERGGGVGARLMHRVRAELQGKSDGRVRGVQGHALSMSGDLSWWVVRASGMRPIFGGYIRYRGMVCEFTVRGGR